MQKHAAKFIILISISFFFASASPSQAAPATLASADSLFEAKRYTQALNQFQQIFEKEGYTHAMLLKMAYIHEALGNVAKTQYFLSLYFLSTDDDSALNKMEELAIKNKLEGYALTDMGKMWLLIKKNATPLVCVNISFIMFAFAGIVRQRKKKGNAYLPLALVMGFCLLLVVFLQRLHGKQSSILLQPSTYLMSGPSSGADVLEIVEAGHKVEVVGKRDVWLRIRWRDEDAFIKEEQLQPIKL